MTIKNTRNLKVSLAKLGKGANVTTDVLVKICEELKCDISDICEIVTDDSHGADVSGICENADRCGK